MSVELYPLPTIQGAEEKPTQTNIRLGLAIIFVFLYNYRELYTNGAYPFEPKRAWLGGSHA